jgi:hypothetical protein
VLADDSFVNVSVAARSFHGCSVTVLQRFHEHRRFGISRNHIARDAATIVGFDHDRSFTLGSAKRWSETEGSNCPFCDNSNGTSRT